MSLLTIVQDACDLCGIARPTVVFGASDTQARQLLGLAKVEGKSLAQRHRWQALTTEATFTTLAAEEQGALESIAPGFSWWIDQSLWNRTTQLAVGGPISPQDWQMQKAQSYSGPYYNFRHKAGKLFMYPAPTAGETLAFEYGSRFWCKSSGGTGQETWLADSDTGILSEHLMTLGLRWRYLQMQGLDYGEAFRAYEMEVNNAIGRDGAHRVLSMDEERLSPRGGVMAPAGGWTP
jgi:hypothetical protein